MNRCQLPTRSGGACPFKDLGRGLCHIHDPDALYARQHPRTRARLLARTDVQAIMSGKTPLETAPTPSHCPSCRCGSGRANVEMMSVSASG